MIVHFVRFASPLSPDDVRNVMRERAPRFRAVQGLIQKHYGDDGEGHYCGIYLFDSQESLDSFRDSDLARSIPAAYQAEDLRIERYEVVGSLHAKTPMLEQI
jgi:hypothetical protein